MPLIATDEAARVSSLSDRSHDIMLEHVGLTLQLGLALEAGLGLVLPLALDVVEGVEAAGFPFALVNIRDSGNVGGRCSGIMAKVSFWSAAGV